VSFISTVAGLTSLGRLLRLVFPECLRSEEACAAEFQ
jgi:hypothetical protein